MAIPYIQPTMAFVRAVDGTYISYPFVEDGDTTTKVYNMVCTQQATDYSASQVALDSTMSSAASAGVLVLPFPADSDAYFVGDTGHAPIGGGMISFTRTFANIPKTTTVASGSAFVTFPGIYSIRTAGIKRSVTSMSMVAGTIGVTLSHSAESGVPIGSNIHASLDYTVGSDPFIHSVNGPFRVLAASTTTTRIDIGHYWSGQVTLNGTGNFVPGDLFRTEESKNVATNMRYDYILPGVTPGISNSIDINLPPSFSVITVSTGEAAKLVSNGTSLVLQTIPTATAYLEMIEEEKNIVIESSLAEWAGNILVMKTKTCKAR